MLDSCFAGLEAKEKAAHNKSIADSGAGRWSNRLRFAILLWFRLDVIYLAFSYYLHQKILNFASAVRAGGFSIPPPSAILVRYLLCRRRRKAGH